MDTNLRIKPISMAELLPGLSGIVSKETMQTLTAKKQPRSAKTATRTAEKILKPLTIAEMRTDLLALKVQSPRRFAQGVTSTKKKWNSSVKLENKTVSHTANGQLQHSSVRKALNFQQPKPKVPKISKISNARMTMSTETPKLRKPQTNAKMSLHLPAPNPVRISGICHIAETPLLMNRPVKNGMTSNKENVPNQTIMNRKTTTPKSCLRNRLLASRIPDTPLSNISWKSSCDASFLEKEKEIECLEAMSKALTEEETLENIAEVSPPVSTPFKEYRNVKEFFNNSSDVMENSTACQDDTIMCFDKTSVSKENGKREESVIVSLCDMLNKAMVSNPNNCNKTNTELEVLIELEKQSRIELKAIEDGIRTLTNIKEAQLKNLNYLTKLINEKRKEHQLETDKEKTVIQRTKDLAQITANNTLTESPVANRPCSVIKSCMKSPSYKIPKKNMSCLRKKVLFRSLPNVSVCKTAATPPKDMGVRALSVYMDMKKHLNFLNTPVKQRAMEEPDTPAMTSRNLQQQLDKLYD